MVNKLTSKRIVEILSTEKRTERQPIWGAWKLFLGNLAQSYADFLIWVKSLFLPNSSVLTDRQLLRKIFQPYYNSFNWLGRLFFPRKGKKSVMKVMFNIETINAFISNLQPTAISTEIIESAKPFHLEGSSDYGILMVHGFCSNPMVMRELGELLNKQGHTIEAILVKGHGTNIRHLTTTDFIDWYESVLQGYIQLSKKCSKIIVVGHSMGGTLSLLLAANRKVEAIVSLCAPLDLGKLYHGLPIPLLPAISKFINKWPRKKDHLKLLDDAGVEVYRTSSLPGVVELFELMEVTRHDLNKIAAPLLIIGATHDYNVPFSNIRLLEQVVNSKRVETFTATKSGHTVLFDQDKEEIFSKVLAFVESIEEDHKRNGEKE